MASKSNVLKKQISVVPLEDSLGDVVEEQRGLESKAE